jgi:hypothetical protein
MDGAHPLDEAPPLEEIVTVFDAATGIRPVPLLITIEFCSADNTSRLTSFTITFSLMFKLRSSQRLLILGDLAALVLVTALGFASHNTLGTAGTRILTTFLPLVAAWFLVGALSGVFDPETASSLRSLWRPALAMIYAAPLFGLFRAWALGTPTITALFVVIMGGTGALAMLLWRSAYALWLAPRVGRRESDG